MITMRTPSELLSRNNEPPAHGMYLNLEAFGNYSGLYTAPLRHVKCPIGGPASLGMDVSFLVRAPGPGGDDVELG